MTQAIGDALLVLSACLALACVVAYQVTTRGAWTRSETGRHLMAFMISLAAVTGLGSARVIAVDIFDTPDPVWFQAVRVAVFTSIPAMFAWRLQVIIRASRSETEDEVSR